MSLWLDWLKEKMGISNSVYYDDGSDTDSSYQESDTDEEYADPHNTEPEPQTPEREGISSGNIAPDLTTDAARRTATLPAAQIVINLDTVREIEDQLDSYEIISLVFLLYEHTHLALQELTLYLEGGDKKLLSQWAQNQQRSPDWQKKLVEALCIVKNYKVLKTYGYKKNDLIYHYLPRSANTTLHVNKIRKALYIMCEKLNAQETRRLIEHMRKTFRDRNLEFKEYDPEYLEIFLLHWETIGFFRPTDCSNLKNVLKILDQDAAYEVIDEVSPRSVVSANAQDAVQSMPAADDNTRTATNSENTQRNRQSITETYNVDDSNPGVVLIINQEEFYTEIDAKYKDLLPPDTKMKLDSRLGTRVDKERLENVFKKFGFKVIVKDNLTHLDMIETIKKVVAGITVESSFFLCILSHGDKGVVYGCNSCKVKVSYIQQLVSKGTLMGKPKVLILQVCQGRQCQILNEGNSDSEESEEMEGEISLTTDGPSSSSQPLPRTADLLLFWATVPGYAAIRDKKNGTWFIQALCNKMEEHQNKIHFLDICTRTCNEVTNKVWESGEEKKAMNPITNHTLRFDFFLPTMKN